MGRAGKSCEVERMNQIALNVDCMEYMQALPDKAFDLAIVDPPYGISIHDSGRLKKYNATETRWDDATPGDVYFSELKRCSKNQIIWGEIITIFRLVGDLLFGTKSSRKIFLLHLANLPGPLSIHLRELFITRRCKKRGKEYIQRKSPWHCTSGC